MDNDYNLNRYYIEDSELLTEAEKIEMARSLRELELKGVIEWRDGAWQLTANVEIEGTEEPVVRWGKCDNCDEAVDPAMGLCPACGYMWCVYDTHECSSSDCEEVELCGEPAVGGHPYCKEHQ